MKTKVEALGYVIEIEEIEGKVNVFATLNDEVVEEFTLEVQAQAQTQVQAQELADEQEQEDFDVEPKLESFEEFLNRRNSKK